MRWEAHQWRWAVFGLYSFTSSFHHSFFFSLKLFAIKHAEGSPKLPNDITSKARNKERIHDALKYTSVNKHFIKRPYSYDMNCPFLGQTFENPQDQRTCPVKFC